MKTPKHPRDYEPDELLLLAMVEAFKCADLNYKELPDCTYFDMQVVAQFNWAVSEQKFDFWLYAYLFNLVPTYHTK
jgi:hypothetical protein